MYLKYILVLGYGAYRTTCRAGTAADALISVYLVMSVTLGNSVAGAT